MPETPEQFVAQPTENAYERERREPEAEQVFKGAFEALERAVAKDGASGERDFLETVRKNSKDTFGFIGVYRKRGMQLMGRLRDLMERYGNVEDASLDSWNRMFRACADEVRPATQEAFLVLLRDKIANDFEYRALTKNNEEIPDEAFAEQGRSYKHVAKDTWEGFPAYKKYGDEHYYNYGGSDAVRYRVYIAAKLSGAPAELLKHFIHAVKAEKFDGISYKFGTELRHRLETIILYREDFRREKENSEEDARYEKLFGRFIEETPRELLLEERFPAAINIGPGIAIAPEPEASIRLAEELGVINDTLSYHGFIASSLELSLQLALRDAEQQGTHFDRLNELKDEAGKYFIEFMKLADFNLETMMPNSSGGKLPEWAEKMRAAYEAEKK